MTLRTRLERIYGSLLHALTPGRGVAWHVDDKTTLRIDPRCRWIRNPSYEAPVVAYLHELRTLASGTMNPNASDDQLSTNGQ